MKKKEPAMLHSFWWLILLLSSVFEVSCTAEKKPKKKLEKSQTGIGRSQTGEKSQTGIGRSQTGEKSQTGIGRSQTGEKSQTWRVTSD